MKLSIIIPVYNEENTILTVLKEIESVQLPQGLEKEIVIVDDGSTDSTPNKIQAYPPNPHIKTFANQRNKGKAFSVNLGIKKSTGDIILVQDADLEYSPRHYPSLVQPLLDNKTDIVYGSRFKGHIKKMTFINRMANQIANLTLNILFQMKLTDYHNGFKIFKKELLKDIVIESKNFCFDTEITTKFLKKEYSILEVPIDYTARKKKDGKKMTWLNALETYLFLIKCRFLS